jgi:peptide deformylase
VAVRTIVQLGDPVLRQVAKRVHRIDESIQRLIDDMIDTVRAANGAGLAAPQIGVPLRIIITNIDDRISVVINPEIVSMSEETAVMEEGCLSIPGYVGPVERAVRCEVRGLGRGGKPIKIRAEDYLARCLQHEVDHINGILYIDRIADKSLIRRVTETTEAAEEAEAETVATKVS